MEAKREYTDAEKFAGLKRRLIFHGFREINAKEKREYSKAISLVVPKGRKPRPGQVAFMWVHMNGMRVFCWTTYNKTSQSFIKKGLAGAWSLVLNQKGEARHKSRQIRRTGKFVRRILKECVINKTRVESSAYCLCGAPMRLAWSRKFLRGRYWICSRAGVHRKSGEEIPTSSFNNGLTGDLLKLVKARDKRRRKYAKKRRAEGKDPQHQMKNRKLWNKGVAT